MSQMKNDIEIKEHDRKLFEEYYKTLQILNESTDDYLYIMTLTGDVRIYYFGKIAKRYQLEPNPKNGYSIEDYSKIVYDHDSAALEEDLRRVLEGEQDNHDMEYRLINREGNQVWISCRGKVVYDEYGRRLFMMGRISDTALLGKSDIMTGLLNAVKFIEDFDETLGQGREGTLFVLGVDNFKNINKTFGKAYGNRLLINLTVMMEDCVDDKFRIYRLDGDRFAINFIGYRQEMVVPVYESIRAQMGEECTFSAGAVSYPLTDVYDANTIYMYAESALERAKKAGKNRLLFFSVEDYTKQLYLIDLTDEMRRSVQNNCEGFFLCYQPLVAVPSGEIRGAEALLRYRSAYHGVVLPEVFLGILEQTGMIVPVGNWVLREAMRQCKEWRGLNPAFGISVNLSYVQLQRKEFSDTLYELLDQIGLPGEAVTLELTESMQLQDFTKYNQLFYRWGRRGVQVAIDGFGAGYSGLSYLKSLAINEIKIDRSFISDIRTSAYNYRLLENVMDLAHNVQVRVCCEGVETAEELRTLAGLGPQVMQGYYFTKPVVSDEFERRYFYDDKEQEEWKKIILAEPEHLEAAGQTGDGSPEDVYKTIVDQVDEIIAVIDVETNEIYYMNGAAKRFSGVDNYRGRKCYQVFRQKDGPCGNCSNQTLDTDKFRTSESVSYIEGKRRLMREKLIRHGGRTMRLEIGYDFSSIEHTQAELEEKLRLDGQIIDSVTGLLDRDRLEYVMKRYLREIGEFYRAERSYLFLVSDLDGTWSNLYEWCENQVESQQVKLLSLPESIIAPWLASFREGKPLVVRDIDIYRESAAETWKVLHMQNIRRVIEAPLIYEGRVIGFIGVDNPKRDSFDETLLMKTAPFLTATLVHSGMVKEELISEAANILKEADIIKDMRIGMWIIETDTNTHSSRMYVDKNMTGLLGVTTAMSEEECYRHWYDNIAGGYQEYVDNAVGEMAMSGRMVELEYPWNHPQLGEIPVRCVGRLSSAENGVYTYKGYHLNTQDMIYKHLPKGEAIKRQYVRKEDFYQAILSETAAYAEVDLESGRMLSAGGMWEHYLPESREKHLTFQNLQDKYSRDMVAAEDYKNYCQYLNVDRIRQYYKEGTSTVNFQFRCNTDEGYRWMELFVHAFQEQDTEKMYALFYMKDINDKKLMNLENERAATRDPLTNVYNRKSFEERAVRYMEEDARNGETCALLIFDIDNFKHINDTYGHQGGDEVLCAFVEMLHETFRRTDYIGRFGGDEFIVFLKNFISQEILSQRLTDFQEKLRNHKPQPIFCSIGIAVVQKEEFDYERCLYQADEALYVCKNQGKNQFSYQAVSAKGSE